MCKEFKMDVKRWIKTWFDLKVAIVSIALFLFLNLSGIQNLGTDTLDFNKWIFLASKGLHFVFLYGIGYKIASLIKNRHTKEGKTELILLAVCFAVYTVLLLLIWPGAWSWDDIDIIRKAQTYLPIAWQHIFSGIAISIFLQTIPLAGGAMLVQAFSASLIAAYCITKLSYAFCSSKKRRILLEILLTAMMFFPPVALYILSGFRMGIYSFLELWLLTKLLLAYKSSQSMSFNDILLIAALGIVIASWRTEAFYYPIVIAVLLLIMGKQKVRRIVVVLMMIVMLLAVAIIGKINTIFVENNNYSLPSTMPAAVELLRVADETDEAEIACFDKVFDTKFALDHPELDGEAVCWSTGTLRSYTEIEYNDYLQALFKMGMKYPNSFFHAYGKLFYKTVGGFGIDGKQTNQTLVDKSILSSDREKQIQQWSLVKSPWKYPINTKARTETMLALGGIDHDKNINAVYTVFWNLWIPLALSLAAIVLRIIKKDWFSVVLMLGLLCRVPIVFFTAPARYFMYYLSVYLCAYVFSVVLIVASVTKHKKSKISEQNAPIPQNI